MSDTPAISVVVPLFRCAPYIEELCQRLIDTLEDMSLGFELILINDGSPMEDWSIIRTLARRDSRIVGVNLTRNFGQHHAITAGLDVARGDWIVVMDGDLQDRPEELPRLYAAIDRETHVVVARRQHRQDSWSKRSSSRLFYRLFDYFTDEKTDESVANFGIYSRQVVDELCRMREQTRSFPLAMKWLGYPAAEVDVEHAPRKQGPSAYSFNKLLNFGLDVIISRSNKPLHISIKLGFLLSFGAVLAALYLVYLQQTADVGVPGWTSIMVTLVFIGGLLFANLGLIGIYLGKIYNEVKARPLYVVREIINRTSD